MYSFDEGSSMIEVFMKLWPLPLRSDARSNEDEAWFSLSRWESADSNPRLLGFGASLLGAAVCFFVAFMTLPFIAINPAKFALAFSLGSLLAPPVHSQTFVSYIDMIKPLLLQQRMELVISVPSTFICHATYKSAHA
ncbi:hypothetical protein F4604DRAFT_1682968 [Suillus subluteus]|nr:hypothetical protein F4604DRAFT_1682968 [Suillus subluteus]